MVSIAFWSSNCARNPGHCSSRSRARQRVAAANDAAAILARGKLIVSVKNAGANAQAEHKGPARFEKRGMELELAHAIAARLLGDPRKMEFKMMRKPQRLQAIADGTVDLGISMLRVTAAVDFSL